MLSLTEQIKGVSNKILATKEIPSDDLTEQQLRFLIGKVIAMCGIKDTPSKEIVGMILHAWSTNYSTRMNKHELSLAFELNMQGELEKKVEHFQCFSVEYFCDIINLYLQKKIQVNKAPKEVIEEPVINPLVEASIQTMKDMIEDRELVSEGKITGRTPIKTRLDLLNELFEVKIEDDVIAKYRELSVVTILSDLNKSRNAIRSDEMKFGRFVELSNQIERLKKGKLITEKDEALIQSEVCKLIYCNELMKWPEKEFIEHIESQL
jgi:hypothetical protein